MPNEPINLLSPDIFRAYDIRGIAGETLSERTVYLIGMAIGSLALDKKTKQIIIARDGRLSGPSLSIALSNGICASGCHVLDIGMAPTPLLYYSALKLGAGSGVMLTGSHNPPEYNGIKIMLAGKTLVQNDLQAIYQQILTKQFHHGQGLYTEKNMSDDYIQYMTQHVRLKRPLNIIIDAGNGVAGRIASELYKKLGCNVSELFCEVDGTFPHHHPDPSQSENLEDLIKAIDREKADIGLAFDGDGDRLGVVTNRGNIICPDRVLMLFAQYILKIHPGAKIIYDVKCTSRLPTLIRSNNGEPIMWKTGHSYIKAKLAETQALLAGEMSGHFFFKDKWFGFDDALYAGARLLEILSQQNQSSDDLFATLPSSINTPEIKIHIKEEEKFSLMDELLAHANFPEADELITLDGLRVNFPYGWGLIRPSNTTPYLILRFEADDEEKLIKIQHAFRQWLSSVKPNLILPF